MTSWNNRAPLLCYIKLYASFQSHRWSNPETFNSGQNLLFLSRVALTFNSWSWKLIRHLFYATSNYVHHFVAIGEFNLELQSQNDRFGSKSAIFLSLVTLKFKGWPWKNNRAPDLCYFELCVSFRSHLWIQTGVTVRKCPYWCENCYDLCDLDLWPLTLTFCMNITSVNGNNSWKFLDDIHVMRGTLLKRCLWRTGPFTVLLGRS